MSAGLFLRRACSQNWYPADRREASREGLVVEQPIEHRFARGCNLHELHAHAVRALGLVRVVLADPGYLADTLQKWRSLRKRDLERNHRTHGVGRAAGEKDPTPGYVGCEPLDKDPFIGVAKLDSDDRNFWSRHEAEYRMPRGDGQPTGCARFRLNSRKALAVVTCAASSGEIPRMWAKVSRVCTTKAGSLRWPR